MLKDYSWKGETFRDFKKRMWFYQTSGITRCNSKLFKLKISSVLYSFSYLESVFGEVLQFELQASKLLGMQLYQLATPPARFCVDIFKLGSHKLFVCVVFELCSSDLCLQSR
jgi:hypothetical protein